MRDLPLELPSGRQLVGARRIGANVKTAVQHVVVVTAAGVPNEVALCGAGARLGWRLNPPWSVRDCLLCERRAASPWVSTL